MKSLDNPTNSHGRFRVEPLAIEGLLLVKRCPIRDARGSFERHFCAFDLAGVCDTSVAQINLAQTKKMGVIRGMHYQVAGDAEQKIITCLAGRIFDVAVDIRESSATYLQWFGVELSSNGHASLVIPRGFAHGYQSLEDNSMVQYVVSTPFKPTAERGLHPFDPKVGIDWPLPCSEMSNKDAQRAFL